MGDILPLKRQAVVDRLRRRFDLQYRRHQEGCYPRYEQAANGLFEQQRQETQLLKQRYLEAKAKKLKKSEQKNSKDPCLNSSSDTQRSLLVQKLNKRQAEGSPLQEGGEDGPDRAPKDRRKDQRDNKNHNTQQQLPSFSVQIVQQFTSSSSAQSQHSQTIQTNVTVKALSGNIKSSNSPLDSTSQAASSGGPGDDLQTSISVGTNIECKRERDTEFGQCSGFNLNRDAPTLSNNSSGGLGSGGDLSHSDRFADTLANLGCFPEDSSDDVIGSDILNDINTSDFFDDIFTNPNDLMKDFNFEDSVGSVRDPSEDASDKDPTGSLLPDMGKGQAFQFPPQQAGMGFEGGQGGNLGGFPPRMSNYPPLSPTLAGLDFKLREPSPAAQTLKQMAEQHQNMQQKQQQLGLGLGPPHPSRSPFSTDSFSDPLSSIRTNFLNGVNMNPKGSNSVPLYNAIPFAQQPQQAQPPGPGHSPGSYGQGLRSGGPMVFKQESSPSFAGQINPSESLDHHKRPTMQRMTPDPKMDQFGTAASPVDQKPSLGPSAGPQQGQPSPSQGSPYAGTRPLSHFTDPGGVHGSLQSSPGGSSRQSPVPSRPGSGPFIRGITPPPNGHFATTVPTRSPSRTTSIQMSQSQQLQISQSNHQLQVSQSQQIQLTPELKPSTPTQPQPPGPPPGPNQGQQGPSHEGVYGPYSQNAPFQLAMSQAQSVTFTSPHQYGGSNGGNSTPPASQLDPSRTHTVVQQQQHIATAHHQRVAPMQPRHAFLNRPPPPEYKSMGKQPGPRYAPRPMGTYQGPEARGPMPGDVMQPVFNSQTLITSQQQQAMSSSQASKTTGPKPVYASALMRNRAPNVNVGPEGLNISQRPPFEWRQMMMQQQQQQQQQRLPMTRFPQCYNRPMAPVSSSGTFPGGHMTRPVMAQQHPPQQQQPPRLPSMATRMVPQQQPRHMLVQQQQQQQMMLQSMLSNLDSSNPVGQGAQQQQLSFQLSSSSSSVSLGQPGMQYGEQTPTDNFNLDFLDSIESSATDLLNFDNVSGAHFNLLDEMGMLGK